MHNYVVFASYNDKIYHNENLLLYTHTLFIY